MHFMELSHPIYYLNKACKRLGMLGRIRNNLTSHCANIIYKSYIRLFSNTVILFGGAVISRETSAACCENSN